MVTSPFISIVWCFRPYKPYIFWKLIIWWWQWPRRILTKRQIQRQRHTYTDKDKYKVLPRPNVCYIYQKQGVQGFKILYWLSSCDDKDKDKILCIIGAEYFSGVNIFQEWIFFRSEYFSGVTIFQEWIFFWGEYFQKLIKNIFHGWIFFKATSFQGWIFFRDKYFSGSTSFQGFHGDMSLWAAWNCKKN